MRPKSPARSEALNGHFLENSLRLQLEDRRLKEILNDGDYGQHRVDRARDSIASLIIAIVERSREQGKLRADLESTDIPLLQVALTALMDMTREIEPAIYRRYVTILLDGLRGDHGPITTLPSAHPRASPPGVQNTRRRCGSRLSGNHGSGRSHRRLTQRSGRVGDTGRDEPQPIDPIIEAELQSALGHRDPLRRIAS